MVSLPSLMVCAVLGVGSDYMLLDFTAAWCGPCQQLQPIVQRLQQEGAPVQTVDIDQRPDLAQRFRVDRIPCFVLVHQGRVLDRAVGGQVTYQRLQQMLQRGQAAGLTSDAATVAAQPPARRRTSLPGGPVVQASAVEPVVPVAAGPQQTALDASVRIRVDEGSTQSFGTGTVIGVHGPDALVITCGHIFRTSRGKGEITVDLFTKGTRRSVPGVLLDYDADERDVAVLTIRPGVRIQPVPIEPAGAAPQVGDPVFSLGCDHGSDPSVLMGALTGVNRYQGAPNLEASGQPVDGRSGGGLFSQAGRLIGICNAADPALQEGIYASLPSVHWILARIGQQQLYAATTPATDAAAIAEGRPQSVEIVCIVRDQDGESRIRVRNPSAELLQRIRQASEQESLSGL